jgi:galactokinase
VSFEIKKLKPIFRKIYGADKAVLNKQFKRYESLLNIFKEKFSEGDLQLFSTPGRVEIGGNHTDHNQGRVLAASVNLDTIAMAAKNKSNTITIYSEGYPKPFLVNLDHLEKVMHEAGTTNALIRGIANRLKQLGFQVGGFNSCVTSDVFPGSGLSSSASIEVLIGTIFNSLYNGGRISTSEIATIGQYAENNFFGKPCGLMDQMTCSVGGIIRIDFKDTNRPKVKKIKSKFSSYNYSLLVVDTGGDHADLTAEYASIPQEMRSLNQLLPRIKELRPKVGDRAILRAFHFLNENDRVSKQVKALESGDFSRFLALVNASGNSSFKWLQNIYATKNVREQGLSLVLALTEKYINDIKAGACRVHGGGFAGTILVFLPNDAVANYIKMMQPILGKGRVLPLNIRPYGTLHLNQF